MSSDTHSLTQKEQESTHVMCIGSHVLTGVVLPPPHSTDHPVSEAVSEAVNHDISHTVLQTFSLCSEGIATAIPSPRVSECVSEREREIDVASIRSLFRNFYSSLDTTQRLSRSVNLHLVVPTQLLGYHKNIILEEARGVAGNLNVCSIHSTAASLCVAAFSENLPHTAPNILCTVEGTRGYCEWDPQPNGNQQRIDILSSHDGIMRVLVVEVSKESVQTSVAEIELFSDRNNGLNDEDEDVEEAMEDESVPGSDTQLTVRIMSTCGSAYGWKAADIQFTGSQLAEVYAADNIDYWISSLFSSSSTRAHQHHATRAEKNDSSKMPAIPSGLFPSFVPARFLEFALPRLAQEITRPYLDENMNSSSRVKTHFVTEGEKIFRLRRLLWIRNIDLEKAYIADDIENMGIMSLVEIEHRLCQHDRINRVRTEDMDCPPSPTSRLPSSIAEQLTWSPARNLSPPPKPKKPTHTNSRRGSTGSDIPLFSSPRPGRTLSGTSTSALSPLAIDSPNALIDKEYDLQEIYMSPFRQYFRKIIARQRLSRHNMNHIDDLDKVVDFKFVLDSCIKKSLERADVQVIGSVMGLNSPSRRRSSRSRGNSLKYEVNNMIRNDNDDADISNGWKTTIEHDSVTLQTPKMILLHVNSGSEGKSDGKILPPSLSTPVDAVHVDNVSPLPGIYASVYQSLHAHAEDVEISGESIFNRDPSNIDAPKTMRSKSVGGRPSSTGSPLIRRYRSEALHNVVLAQMNNHSLYQGARASAAAFAYPSVATCARIYEAPISIGIRIANRRNNLSSVALETKPNENNEKNVKSFADEKSYFNQILWMSGTPPKGCCFVKNFAGVPTLNIDDTHFGNLPSPSKKIVDDTFYDEHIEKYHPSCRLKLSDDEEDKDYEEDSFDTGERSTCWRERSSISSCEEEDQDEFIHHIQANKVEQIDETSAVDKSIVGIGLKSLFSGGFSDDMRITLHFHGNHGVCSDTPKSLAENPRCMSRSVSVLSEDLTLYPSGMVWSATENLPDVIPEAIVSRCLSDDSYVSFITEETDMRPSWDSSTVQPSGVVRHVLVEARESNTSSEIENDSDICERKPAPDRGTVADWCVEVVQFVESPTFLSETPKLNVSVLHTIPFPKQDATDSANGHSSFTIDINMDPTSGCVGCRLQEENTIDSGSSGLVALSDSLSNGVVSTYLVYFQNILNSLWKLFFSNITGKLCIVAVCITVVFVLVLFR